MHIHSTVTHTYTQTYTHRNTLVHLTFKTHHKHSNTVKICPYAFVFERYEREVKNRQKNDTHTHTHTQTFTKYVKNPHTVMLTHMTVYI